MKRLTQKLNNAIVVRGDRVFLRTVNGPRFVGEFGEWLGRPSFIRRVKPQALLRWIGDGQGGYAWSTALLTELQQFLIHHLVIEESHRQCTLWIPLDSVLQWGYRFEHPPWGEQIGARLMDMSLEPWGNNQAQQMSLLEA